MSKANKAAPKQPGRAGRPKLADEHTRVKHFGFRCTEAEANRLTELAASRGLPPGTLARIAALKQPMPAAVVPEINRQAWSELARAVGNLNQIAYRANLGEPVTVDSDLLVSLREDVQALRRQLLSAESDDR